MKRGGESLGKHNNYLATMYFNESDSFSLIQIDPGFRIFLWVPIDSDSDSGFELIHELIQFRVNSTL